MRVHLLIHLFILAAFAAGCQSHNNQAGSSTGPGTSVNPPSPQPSQLAPAAYLDGEAVTRAQLYRIMIESQGGQALSEILLDRAITKRLVQESFELGDADIQAEKQQLMNSLSTDPDQATRLLDSMRAQRGLGEQRFAALLRRNAGLRRLVRDSITVTDSAVQQAYQLRYGTRYRVRLITANNVATLSNVRRRTLGGESFTDLAIAVSTDRSAAQGGLLSPINPIDATYPKAIRDALPKLGMGQPDQRLSSVIALPEGYALLWLEEVVSSDAPPIEQERDRLEQIVRIELERVRMQQLARVMVSEANVIVLDLALDTAWKRQRNTIVAP